MACKYLHSCGTGVKVVGQQEAQNQQHFLKYGGMEWPQGPAVLQEYLWVRHCGYQCVLYCPCCLVIRRFHSFVALGPSLIGLCWPEHFISTWNAVYEMRQETCTDVAMGENIASQCCCMITEASLLLPPRTAQRCLYLFPFLLYK